MAGSEDDISEKEAESQDLSTKDIIYEDDSPLVRELFECVQNSNFSTFNLLLKQYPYLARSIASDGSSTLHLAVIAGNSVMIRHLLELVSPDFLEIGNFAGHTAVDLAVIRRSWATVSAFLLKNSNLETVVKNRLGLVLVDAVIGDDMKSATEVLSFSIPGVQSYYIKEKFKRQALYHAAYNGNLNMVRLLLKCIVGPIWLAREGLNPLHAVAKASGSIGIATTLVKHQRLFISADKVRKDGDGNTPLHLATEHGNTELALYFMEIEPSLVRKVNKKGDTVLHAATRQLQVQMVQDLVARPDVDVDASNALKMTALDLADEMLKSCESSDEAALRSVRAILLNAGANSGQASGIESCSGCGCLLEGDTIGMKNPSPQRILRNGESHTCEGSRSHDIVNGDASVMAGSLIITNKHVVTGMGGSVSSESYKSAGAESNGSGLQEEMVAIDEKVNDHAQTGQAIETGEDVKQIAGSRQNDHGDRDGVNTVVIVALLIATLAFAALVFTAPGGLQTDGDEKGAAARVHTVAFHVFVLSISVALFMSLALVVILVTVIPMRGKFRRRLVSWTIKAVWAAVSCTAIAVMAAGFITAGPGAKYLAILVCVVGLVILPPVVCGMAFLTARYHAKKSAWRKKAKRGKAACSRGGSFHSGEFLESQHTGFP